MQSANLLNYIWHTKRVLLPEHLFLIWAVERTNVMYTEIWNYNLMQNRRAWLPRRNKRRIVIPTATIQHHSNNSASTAIACQHKLIISTKWATQWQSMIGHRQTGTGMGLRVYLWSIDHWSQTHHHQMIIPYTNGACQLLSQFQLCSRAWVMVPLPSHMYIPNIPC